MKKIFYCLVMLGFTLMYSQSLLSQVTGISISADGISPASSAMLDIRSTTKGLLIPRMLSSERMAIQSPALGLLTFDNTTNNFWFRGPARWQQLSPWNEDPFYTRYSNSSLPLLIQNGVETGFGEGMLNLAMTGTTNTVQDVMVLYRGTAGTPAAGIGSSILFRNEYGGGNSMGIAGRITSAMESYPPERHSLRFTAYENGTGTAQLFVSPTAVGIGQTPVVANSKLEVWGNIVTTGELNRPATGTASLTPLAYGVISAAGAITGGTGNFSVSREEAGRYLVGVPSITLSTTTDVINVTPVNFSSRMATAISASNSILVTITNQAGTAIDTPFNFVIYKL